MSAPKKFRSFELRKVRNGSVRIHGKTYRPEERWLKYDGRLDGMVMAFGIYDYAHDFVSLWGTAEAYNAKTEEESKRLWPGPECVNGKFSWGCWRKA